MNFIEIFKEAGLYTFKETSDGVAFRIKEDITGNNLEMRIVIYTKPDQKEDSVRELREYALTPHLVNMDYVKVKSVKELFGEDRKKIFNALDLKFFLLEQAYEIIRKSGECPKVTLGSKDCPKCIYTHMNKTSDGCNMNKVYGVAAAYIQITK